MNEKKYGVASSQDAEQWTGLFGSVEEAIAKGRIELDLDSDAKWIFVGEADLFQPAIDVDLVFENLIEQCDSECGEASEHWAPSDAGTPAKDELENMLNETLYTWMKKHDQVPTCYTVSNIIRCELPPNP